ARRPDAEAEAQGQAEAAVYDADGDDSDRSDRSGAAIASESQAGILVGRSVAASTVAWDVQPSAITPPARPTAYSNRKRAPRTAWQRVWISSRSSNAAGARYLTCDSSTNDSMPRSRRRW